MRNFLAIPIDRNTQARLKKGVETLQQYRWANDIVWFPPENYHITLHFLGSAVLATKIRQVCHRMNEWFNGDIEAFSLTIKGLELFPSTLKAHSLVALIENSPELRHLVDQVEQQLNALGFCRSQQTFIPHITLGRIPRTQDLQKIHIPSDLALNFELALPVNKITLFQSQLTEHSPIYTPLQSKSLK